jgi:hypothetical protein
MQREDEMSKPMHARRALVVLTLAAGVMGARGSAWAQSFNSGSACPGTACDGALDLTGVPSGKTVLFKPASPTDDPATPSIETVLGRSLNWDDTRFDFTTITIPSGVTLRLSAKWTNGPMYWLASGAVNIVGVVDLSGEPGHPRTKAASERRPSIPGPGGFPGGVGGNSDPLVGNAQPGAGPGGGAINMNVGGYMDGGGATYQASKFLVPLQGGSGAGGGQSPDYLTFGSGGGAGGGAILIASSVSIAVSGTVRSDGGFAGLMANVTCYVGAGGSGSGGSIRLAAPIIQGGGLLAANGASNYCNRCDGSYGFLCSSSGRVRLDAFTHNWTFSIQAAYTTGSPVSSFVPSGPPPGIVVSSITATVNGTPVPIFLPDKPTGSFDVPDAVINSSTAVTLEIRARGVPVGKVADLYVFSLEGADQVIHSPPLASFDDPAHKYTTSTTVQITLPSGLSRGYVRAKW